MDRGFSRAALPLGCRSRTAIVLLSALTARPSTLLLTHGLFDGVRGEPRDVQACRTRHFLRLSLDLAGGSVNSVCTCRHEASLDHSLGSESGEQINRKSWASAASAAVLFLFPLHRVSQSASHSALGPFLPDPFLDGDTF